MDLFEYLYLYSQEIKDLSAAVQSIIISIGVIFGGWWTYWIFYKNRQIYPRANISHEISHKTGIGDRIYLRVAVKISNDGNVVIRLNNCDIRIQQIKPVNDDINKSVKGHCQKKKREEFWDNEIKWPTIDRINGCWEKEKIEIESGESDQFYFDFMLDSKIETILIYTYITNLKKKKKTELGWSLSTMYDIKKEAEYGKDK